MGFERDYRELPLTWERGMVETVEASMLPIGAAPRLRNWEADPSGNLRSRVGWQRGSVTGAPATRRGHGIGYFTRQIAPGIVQKSDVSSGALASTGGSLSATWKRKTTRGNLLILVAGFSLSDGSTTITPGTDWTNAVTSTDTNGRPRVGIWYIQNSAPRQGAESVMFAGMTSGNSFYVQLLEISGIALTSALDQTTSNTAATTTSPSTGTTTATTQAVEFAIGAICHEQGESQSSPTSGFAQLGQAIGPGDCTLGTYGKALSATGTQSVGVTVSTSSDHGSAIATFKSWFTGTPGSALRAGRFVVAQDDTTEYDLFQIDSDDLASGSLSSVESVSVSSTAGLVAFAPGFSRLFYTHPLFETTRAWDGLTGAAVTGSPAGRCIAVHKDRLYVGGTNGDPTLLFFSEVGDPGIWDSGTASNIPVGSSDGEPIEDITPFQDGLLIGKQTSLWYLSGSGPDNYRLIRLPIGGAAPGRSILSTPNGAIVAGRKDVWLVNGGTVDLISGPIRESYGITGDWMTVSFVNDQAYILDQGSGTAWVIDFSNGGTWREERIDSATTEGPACIYNQDNRQLYTPKAATVGSLLNYRELPGSARQKDFDTLTQTWVAWTPEIWPVGPQEKITPRYLFLKLRQRAGDAGDNAISVTPVYDGIAITARTITPAAAAAVDWYRLDIGDNVSGKGVSSAQFKIEHTLDSTETAVFDIEELTFGFNVESVV